MSVFKSRKIRKEVLKVSDIKVAKATIMLSEKDVTGFEGIRCEECYLLVKKVNGKYYEIFSNKQIKKFGYEESKGYLYEFFDTPYIESIIPLREYMTNPQENTVEADLLFDFILNMNLRNRHGDFEDETKN